MAEIIGAIDWFKEPNLFLGWAQSETDGTPDTVEIRAILGGTVIGACIADVERPGNAIAKSFHLEISEEFSPEDILNENITFMAFTGEKKSQKLPIYSRLKESLTALVISRALDGTTDEEFCRIMDRATAKHQSGIKANINNAIKLAAAETGAKNSLWPESRKPETSAFDMFIGALSTNRAVTIGRDGHLFLSGGTNNLIDQLKIPLDDPRVTTKTSEWADLIRSREKSISSRGMNFLQVIIPEKTSVLHDLFPLDVKTPTPYLSSLQNKISEDESLSSCVYDSYHTLMKSTDRLKAFRNLDSHMSARGNQIVFQGILESIGYSEEINYDLPNQIYYIGDMIRHFPGMPAGAYDELPDRNDFKQREERLEILEAYYPPDGAHIGRRKIWRNLNAAIPLKVVVFGNSFFEMGIQAISLSWWFARWFKEFHFLWEVDLDYDYVDRVKPDLVINQTIERFLVRVPNA